MTDQHYLLRVLGISAVPRFLTFALKLVSFPLMVRKLGATEFGIVVYLTAVISVFESFVDFGVSSAAGKEIAVARETSSVSLPLMIKKWARFQSGAAILGLAPLLLITYLIASIGSQIKFSFEVLLVLVLSTWITIGLNFVRAALTSILAFKWLGLLDACESILRSAGWLGVAYYYPTNLGFAWASLMTVILASTIGIIMLWRLTSRYEKQTIVEESAEHVSLRPRTMFSESLNFLWLRFVTRVFLAIPIIVFGRLFGSEVVGIVGAFARIVELVNFPFSVIGNALAVRAPGVLIKGINASRVLWDAASRFISVSIMLAATMYLGAQLLGRFVLPNSQNASTLLAILAVSVVSNAVSSIIAPMSDYVGALRSRNILLTIFSIVQVPMIYAGALIHGTVGGIIAYVLALLLMNFGYIRIALGVFFPAAHYRCRPELNYFLVVTITALVLIRLFHFAAHAAYVKAAIDIALFWTMVLAALVLHRPSKKFFLTRIFFDFQLRNSSPIMG